MSPAAVTLTDEQLDDLADRIAARLCPIGDTAADAFADVAAVARALGVSRSFVYQHANELGARRLNGHGRLRFEMERAREAFAEMPALTGTPPPRRKRHATTSRRPHVLQSRPRKAA